MKRNRRDAWSRIVIALAAMASLVSPAVLQSQSAAPAPPPLLFGTAWYPEQWPESRWDRDLTLMQQAEIHLVRVGEFAWSRMEPSEGQYDLDWLDRAIAAAAKHGIYTVLGTPTAAPPAWLTQKYPETLRIDEERPPRRTRKSAAVRLRECQVSGTGAENRRTDGPALRPQSVRTRLAD